MKVQDAIIQLAEALAEERQQDHEQISSLVNKLHEKYEEIDKTRQNTQLEQYAKEVSKIRADHKNIGRSTKQRVDKVKEDLVD